MTKKGFTLIELLVVIAIIGILSAVVLTSLNSSRSKANDATYVNDVKQVALAMELARSQQTGAFPTATSSLSAYLNPYPANVSFEANTASSSQFCVHASLSEYAEGDYFAASQDGSGYTDTAPTLASCF